jgi:hypothetical protein
VKTTPINFSPIVESHLRRYWSEHRLAKGKKVDIQRTHNLLLRQTTLNAFSKPREGNPALLCSIQLIEIPQQEINPAINALIYLPHLNRPTQLLMVFKTDSDVDGWCTKLIEKLSLLMLGAPDDSPAPAAPERSSDM